MMWVGLLFLLGLLLISAEVILPGGIAGAMGALALLIGCGIAYAEHGPYGAMVALVAAVVLVMLALYVEFWILPKTSIGRRAFLHSEVRGDAAAYGEETLLLVGQRAIAETMLSPSGYVMIDGMRYEAFCQNGQIPAGTQLTVVSTDNFRLIVKTLNEPSI